MSVYLLLIIQFSETRARMSPPGGDSRTNPTTSRHVANVHETTGKWWLFDRGLETCPNSQKYTEWFCVTGETPVQ